MMMNTMDQGWGMELSWIVGFIVVVIIIWLIVKVMNLRKNLAMSNFKSPLYFLKKRYAKGEISKKKFKRKSKIIF
jgi:uncharacterized membrane protein